MAKFTDPTPIDLSKEYQISELVEFIRTKMDGHDVREALALGLERNYEDAAQNGNANMEVTQARGSYPTLARRLLELDETDNDITTQLAQTEGRISEIIASAGDGSIPTELIDIRTVEGQTYEVAGDALRESYEDLKNTQEYIGNFDNINLFTDLQTRQSTFTSSTAFTNVDYSITDVYFETGKFISLSFEVRAEPDTKIDYYYRTGESNIINGSFHASTEWTKYTDIIKFNVNNQPPTLRFRNLNMTSFEIRNVSIDQREKRIIASKLDDDLTRDLTLGHLNDLILKNEIALSELGVSFEIGGFYNETKENADTIKTRVRSSYIPIKKGFSIELLPESDFDYIRFTLYNNNGEFVDFDNSKTMYDVGETGTIRLLIGYSDLREITANDLIKAQEAVVIKKPRQINVLKDGSFSNFYKPKKITTELDILNTTFNDVYQSFDSAVESLPMNVTKNLKGYGSDINGIPDENLPIYEYHFQTNRQHPMSNDIEESETILILAGLHGAEKSTMWSLVHLLKESIEKVHEHEGLHNLIANVNFKIIPVANPGGYSDNTRQNRNKVDLNRNFGPNWETTNDGNPKGAEPYSEPETKIIRDWLQENSDALAFIDFHNSFEADATSFFSTPDKKAQNIYTKLIRKLTVKWHKEYSVLSQEDGVVDGYIVSGKLPSTVWEAYTNTNIKYNAILEITRTYRGTHMATETVELGSDLLINYLLDVVDESSKVKLLREYLDE